MKKSCVVAVIVLSVVAGMHADEAVARHSGSIRTEATAMVASGSSVPPTVAFELSADNLIASVGEAIAFRAALSVGFAADGRLETVDIDELSLTIGVTEWWSLTAGRLQAPNAAIEFFPLLCPFYPVSPIAVPVGGIRRARSSVDLIQTTLDLGPLYLRAAAAVTSPRAPILPVTSQWFPREIYPEVLYIPNFPNNPDYYRLERGDILYEPLVPAVPKLRDASISGEVGVRFPYVGLSALYYHGWNNAAPLGYDIIIHNYTDPFSIVLKPQHHRIDLLGAAAEATLGPVGLSVEAAHVWGKAFLPADRDPLDLESAVTTGRSLRITAGVFTEIALLNSDVRFEYTREIPGAGLDVSTDPFSHALGLRGRTSFWADSMRAVLYSYYLVGNGVGVGVRVQTMLKSGIQVDLNVPVFFGRNGAFLAQYSEMYTGTLGITLSY